MPESFFDFSTVLMSKKVSKVTSLPSSHEASHSSQTDNVSLVAMICVRITHPCLQRGQRVFMGNWEGGLGLYRRFVVSGQVWLGSPSQLDSKLGRLMNHD